MPTTYQFEGKLARLRTPPGGLNTPVQYLKGAGPRKSELLARLGIQTLHDLLLYFPRHHEDRRLRMPIAQVPNGAKTAVEGTVVRSNTKRIGKNLSMTQAILQDDTGILEAIWYKRFSYQYDVFSHLKRFLVPGGKIRVYGTVDTTRNKREMRVEAYDTPKLKGELNLHFGRLVPIYGMTRGLEDRWMREFMWRHVCEHSGFLVDPLPQALKGKFDLADLGWSVKTYHFPDTEEDLLKAKRRLAFEELFVLEVALAGSRRRHKSVPKPTPCRPTRTLLTPFKEKLGFGFTRSQTRVINEIFRDMGDSKPMNRLLQGDVGSGKTVVAASAILLCVENNLQSAFLAPTEILAQQHALTWEGWLSHLPVTCRLLTGSTSKKDRQRILEELASGTCQILVGTHALLEDNVAFKNLGLVVIDEQHRFGVRQRQRLTEKNAHPTDALIMTATPIPRTLALTLYADLDVSVLEELPKDRKPVTTLAIREEEAHEKMRKELERGRQGYYIFPLVEDSPELGARGKLIKAAKREFERLKVEVFPQFTLGLLHGQMPFKEKAETMEKFRSGAVQLLVATSVIEVGIDVPNATVLAIAHPERFGLAQLHQLRGRIGRGKDPGTCLAILSPEEGLLPTSERLNIFCRTFNGFKLAEEDLRIRGPGEFMGVSQHGDAPLRVANLVSDAALIMPAREEARSLIEKDPLLKQAEHRELYKEVRRKFHALMDFAKVG